MELYSRTTIWGLEDDEARSVKLSSQPLTLKKLFESNLPITPARLSSARLSSASASAVSVVPSSPESPWALSPLRANPSPSLLYHCIATLHRLDGAIYSIAISKGMVFTGSASRRIRVWRHPECLDRGCIKTSSGHVRVVLAFDTMLFTAHSDHKIRVWNVSVSDRLRSKKLATLPQRSHLLAFPSRQTRRQHRDVISCLAYNHAEGLLYSASWDKTVKTWKVAERRCVDTFVAHDERINAIIVNQEDGFVFTGSSDASIKIWRRICGELSHSLTMVLRFQPSPVNALALTTIQGSCFLYSASSDGLINFWCKDSMSGRYQHGGFLQGHRLGVLCLMTLNKLIFSGSEDTTIRVWSRKEGSSFHVCMAVLEGHRGPVKCLAACVEIEEVMMAFLVYSVSLDRMVKVWRIKVLAGNQKMSEGSENSDAQQQITLDYDMISPVLSPSWIEKRLQDVS
ncbi:protein JINGUBANG-like [Aristolochia californica]|uniref:protein JINGUBANG-like n=1 Tax=Aristolochia californica TaxID=171875 RepID=UPI0035D7F465